ncbi:MAG: 2-polyprenylphenol 6-hydroxylase [Pseudomonadota bacterium]
MANALSNLARLARAGFVMAQYGVRFVPEKIPTPFALKLASALTAPVRVVSGLFRSKRSRRARVADALGKLGPSYIKLGQFMATRADVIGPDLAADLSVLQDKMKPFAQARARASIEAALGGTLEAYFSAFGPAIAAASIAQVHRATTLEAGNRGAARDVAVKILRPGIEKRFRQDLDSFFFAARQIERFHKPSRRLRPLAVVDNLRETTELEMDLRLEAAAISEMADNIAQDTGFRVPQVDWHRTAKRVLTLEWIEGIPIGNTAALREAGHDTRALGMTVLQSFLRHAMRDGFFHADMHQGNLLVEPDGTVVAVDFGIMGRLTAIEQRFLAEILFGLITRDYARAARVHFDAGYVPSHQSVAVFAQAMRAIGEPIHGRTADEISMAELLGQLFAYTEIFDMETRPELILLQKSMVIVEGVARGLDPELNLWTAAEPIARTWLEENMGAAAALKDAREGAGEVGKLITHLPRLAQRAERAGEALQRLADGGVKLDEKSVAQVRAPNRADVAGRVALWIGALALAALAVMQYLEM